MGEVIKYFASKNLSVTLNNGKINITGQNSHLISQDIKKNPYLKIALLSESLDYQKPGYSSVENITKNKSLMSNIFSKRKEFSKNRPDPYTKQQKEIIKQNKRKDLDLVSQQELFYHQQAYKVF